MLQAAWPFDVVQHGYVIRFVARGGTSVVTISAADLDARGAGQEPGVQITTSREMDSQLPRRVTVQHLDYDREYNTGTQYAERLNTAAINARVLDLPIVLTATEAAGRRKCCSISTGWSAMTWRSLCHRRTTRSNPVTW